jgi:uncharacterized protein YdhG (YjbR/CyaY superfamily)
MKAKRSIAVDGYIAAAQPAARVALRKIRAVVRAAAPAAEEIMSYRIPAFRQGRVLIYFAAFKSHIGVFPPVRGDRALERAASRYRGPKGNLKFPLDQPIPYKLIERIVKWRVSQLAPVSPSRAGKSAPRRRTRRGRSAPSSA